MTQPPAYWLHWRLADQECLAMFQGGTRRERKAAFDPQRHRDLCAARRAARDQLDRACSELAAEWDRYVAAAA